MAYVCKHLNIVDVDRPCPVCRAYISPEMQAEKEYFEDLVAGGMDEAEAAEKAEKYFLSL